MSRWRQEVEDGTADLGDGHLLRFYSWRPDRDLNPQYEDLADVERMGAIISHFVPGTDSRHEGSVLFDGEVARRLFPGDPVWTVESYDPLTLTPSVACSCGDHGWVRGGRWVSA